MTFQVVTFLKSKKEVEIVPTVWTFTENGVVYTYWPRLRDLDGIKAAAKAEDPPNKSKWGKYAIRVLHSFNSYDEAEANLSYFYENSDFGSFRPTPLSESFQSQSRSDSSSPESVPSKFQLALPPQPSALRPILMDTPKSRPRHEKQKVAREINNSEMQRYLDIKFKELELSLGRKLVELERQQQDMVAVLEELRGTVQTIPTKITTVQNWREQGLPFTMYDPLVDFDQKLELNSKLRQDLVMWLSRSGGNTVAEAVNAMMSKVMTDDVALKLTFFGTSTKAAFQSLNLKDAVYEAVVLVLADTDEKQFRLKVQSFLDHASDHIKAKKNSELKKQKKSAE